MTTTTYNTITATLASGVLIAFVVAVFCLIVMIARWKTPKRRSHVIRLATALAAIPCLIGTQQAADPDRNIYAFFAKESIPRTLVISPEGRIVYSKTGFYEEDLNELNAVLKEQFASLK